MIFFFFSSLIDMWQSLVDAPIFSPIYRFMLFDLCLCIYVCETAEDFNLNNFHVCLEFKRFRDQLFPFKVNIKLIAN